MWFDEEEVKNLRQALQGELPQRQFGLAVRLEVAANCAPELAQLLLQPFRARRAAICTAATGRSISPDLRPWSMGRTATELEYPPFVPGMPERLRDQPDMLAAIRRHDILLHHPLSVLRSGRRLHPQGMR